MVNNILKFSIYLLLVTSLSSCQNNPSFEHDFDFGKEMIWNAPIEWKWNVQKNDKSYRISMDLQCGVHYPFENLPIEWIEIKPNGQRISHELEIIVRNPDGSFNGDKALDYLNFEVVLSDNHHFETFGEYTFILQQKTGLNEAPFMVNIEIDAEELDNY